MDRCEKKKESYDRFLSFSVLILSMLSSLSVSWLRSILIVFITFLTKHDNQCDGSNPGNKVQQDPPASATRVVKSSDTNGIRREHQQQSHNDRQSDHQLIHFNGILEHDDHYIYHEQDHAQNEVEQEKNPHSLRDARVEKSAYFLPKHTFTASFKVIIPTFYFSTQI